MHILIVTQYFWPENFRINDLTSALVTRGHQVTVLTGKPNYPSGCVFPEFKNNPEFFSIFETYPVIRAPMLLRGQGSFRLVLNYLSFAFGAAWSGLLKLRGQSFDVIFVFEPSPVTVGLPAILLGKIKKIPIIFWALDLWPETLAAIGIVRSPRILLWIGYLVSFIYNRCTLILGQSKGFLSNIKLYCNDANKIRYFPNWSEYIYATDRYKLALEVPHRPDLFNIVFAGNIGEAQDMQAVLDSATALKNDKQIRWLIVGDGRKSDWLAAQVKNLALGDNFLLLGRHPSERMPEFYAHADALLVSLKKDPVFSMTIPGKVQSYLMAGKPILGMLDGEGATVIQEANAGLTCNAGDSVGLTHAIRTMAAMSSEARKKLAQNGVLYAKQEFGREQIMDKLESLLYEAVHTHHKGLR
jgi:colanic acid biosynthesis glycosyl transferase WcaI